MPIDDALREAHRRGRERPRAAARSRAPTGCARCASRRSRSRRAASRPSKRSCASRRRIPTSPVSAALRQRFARPHAATASRARGRPALARRLLLPSRRCAASNRSSRKTVARDASDLHLSAGIAPPHPPARRAGRARPSAAGTRRRPGALLRRPAPTRSGDASRPTRELDFAVTMPGLGRFRGNLYLARGSVGGAFRVIPRRRFPPSTTLGLPPVVASLATPATRAGARHRRRREAARAPRSPRSSIW